jgi:hypothetical protein
MCGCECVDVCVALSVFGLCGDHVSECGCECECMCGCECVSVRVAVSVWAYVSL